MPALREMLEELGLDVVEEADLARVDLRLDRQPDTRTDPDALVLWQEHTISAWRANIDPRPLTPGTFWSRVDRWSLR